MESKNYYLIKSVDTSVFSFQEALEQEVPQEEVQYYVNYLSGLDLEIFEICKNQIMTDKGLYIVVSEETLTQSDNRD